MLILCQAMLINWETGMNNNKNLWPLFLTVWQVRQNCTSSSVIRATRNIDTKCQGGSLPWRDRGRLPGGGDPWAGCYRLNEWNVHSWKVEARGSIRGELAEVVFFDGPLGVTAPASSVALLTIWSIPLPGDSKQYTQPHLPLSSTVLGPGLGSSALANKNTGHPIWISDKW